MSCFISGVCLVVGSAKWLSVLKNSVCLFNYGYLYSERFAMRHEMESNPVSSLSTVVVRSVVYRIEGILGCVRSVRYIVSCSAQIQQCIV